MTVHWFIGNDENWNNSINEAKTHCGIMSKRRDKAFWDRRLFEETPEHYRCTVCSSVLHLITLSKSVL